MTTPSEQTNPDPQTQLPVARVLPLVQVPHLDRGFDYLVPEEMRVEAQPGTRVRVRFNGKLVTAIVLQRLAHSDFDGELMPLNAVFSPEVVIPPQTQALIDRVAVHYAGYRPDIIRSAIPTRHARVEKQRAANRSKNSTNPDQAAAPTWEELGKLNVADLDLSPWQRYRFAESYINAVLAGRTARAVWQPVPGENHYDLLARLAIKIAYSGGGVLLVAPDTRRVARLEAAFTQLISPRQLTVLTGDLSPEPRYRRYLDILHGQGRIVVGTRSCVFAPVQNLRLVIVLDDDDDNLVDRRHPYWHSREVLVMRSELENCAFLSVNQTRSVAMEHLLQQSWAHELVAVPDTLESALPQLIPSRDSIEDPENQSRTRLPAVAFKLIKAALRDDQPVLVQVPRRGYIRTLTCARCRHPARCRSCNGPLGIPEAPEGEAAAPSCRWCGRVDAAYRCTNCGSKLIRPVSVGSSRTREELGRAFRPYPVAMSTGENLITDVPPGGRIVVTTPGAEPDPGPPGYAVTLILDTWVSLGFQDLRASEEALANWVRAACLTRSAAAGGAVIIDGDAAVDPIGDFVSWNLAGAARRELADRGAAGLPPTVSVAAIDGSRKAIELYRKELAQSDVALPDNSEFLGPVALPSTVPNLPGADPDEPFLRLLVRSPNAAREQFGLALQSAIRMRALARDDDIVRVIVDPVRFG